jgi:hypothetical protein
MKAPGYPLAQNNAPAATFGGLLCRSFGSPRLIEALCSTPQSCGLNKRKLIETEPRCALLQCFYINLMTDAATRLSH